MELKLNGHFDAGTVNFEALRLQNGDLLLVRFDQGRVSDEMAMSMGEALEQGLKSSGLQVVVVLIDHKLDLERVSASHLEALGYRRVQVVVHHEDYVDRCPNGRGDATQHADQVSCMWCLGRLSGEARPGPDGTVEVLKGA